MSAVDQSTPLAALTTMAVGGVPAQYRVATTRDELARVAAELSSGDETWCVLAGGSNSIFSDAGFPGVVLLVRTDGIVEEQATERAVQLRVEAGHTWDDLVA